MCMYIQCVYIRSPLGWSIGAFLKVHGLILGPFTKLWYESLHPETYLDGLTDTEQVLDVKFMTCGHVFKVCVDFCMY